MISETRLRGAVRLPTPMQVAEAALGQQFEVEIGSGVIRVTLPVAPGHDPHGWHSLVCPWPDADDIDGLMRGYDLDGGWGHVSLIDHNAVPPKLLLSKVLALAIEARLGRVNSPAPDAAIVAGQTFDTWWLNVLTWLELWTPQHLIPDANSRLRSRGHVYDMESEPPALTGWGLSGEVRVYGSEHALTRAMLAAAISRAAEGEFPPLEWRLLCRAHRLRDRRQALMNAAAAAEVALAHSVHMRIGQAAEQAREQISKNTNGIVGMLQLVEELDGLSKSASRRGRIAHRVAGPRNDAATKG
jgi:hypothetical protein